MYRNKIIANYLEYHIELCDWELQKEDQDSF